MRKGVERRTHIKQGERDEEEEEGRIVKTKCNYRGSISTSFFLSGHLKCTHISSLITFKMHYWEEGIMIDLLW